MATTKGGLGKAFRTGISLRKLMVMFPTDDTAREWLEAQFWPNGPYCPRCGSFNVQRGIRHKSMTHRCRACEGKPRFSLKTGNVMTGSKLGYRTWAVAIILAMAGAKGVSSMKLHRDLKITQKSAWHLARRVRRMLDGGRVPMFQIPAESDGTGDGAGVNDRETDRTETRRMAGAGAGMRNTGQR